MRTTLLTSFLFITLMIGCKKGSDNVTNTSNSPLVGFWELTQHKMIYAKDSTTSYVTAELGSVIKFNSDNTYTWTFTSGSQSGSWSIDGKKLTLTRTGKSPFVYDEYNVEGAKLILIFIDPFHDSYYTHTEEYIKK